MKRTGFSEGEHQWPLEVAGSRQVVRGSGPLTIAQCVPQRRDNAPAPLSPEEDDEENRQRDRRRCLLRGSVSVDSHRASCVALCEASRHDGCHSFCVTRSRRPPARAPLVAGGLLSVKTPWQCLRGAVQGSAEAPGRVAATISAWSRGNPSSEPLRRSSGGSGPCRSGGRTSSGPNLLSSLYSRRNPPGNRAVRGVTGSAVDCH